MKVIFNEKNLTIDYVENNDIVYQIDLEICCNSAELLDWIFQIYNKSWSTSDIINNTLEELERACKTIFNNSVQGMFCPNGVDKEVYWS